MRYFLILMACIGLALTLLPSFAVWLGWIDLQANKWLMVAGSISWLLAASMLARLNPKREK